MATPTYPLATVKVQVNLLRAKAFTASALNGGQGQLGLTLAEMISTINSGVEADCFKTMPSLKVPGAYQDVYHLNTPYLDMAYVKFCLHSQSDVVISFKRK